MYTLLHPNPRVGMRLIALAALAAFISIGHASWISKLGFVCCMAFFLGSYRVARLKDGYFERQMVFMFIPLRLRRWQLDRCIQIETVFEESMNIGWALLIGPVLWLWFRFFDWLLPWIGGGYVLRLRRAKGGQVLVWQGNSETNFHANLEILKNNT